MALKLPWDAATSSLVLNRDTMKAWPFIQPIFAEGGYFPLGLTISSPPPVAASEIEATVTGIATIDSADFATEARFSGSGSHVELELAIVVPLASLMGSGSALTATWEPKITFRSSAGKRTIDLHAARGKICIGSIELEAEVKMPGLRIEAKIERPKKSLSDFMAEYAVDGLAPGLMLQNMRLHANPGRGAYSVSVAASGKWSILPPHLELTGIAAHVLYASEVRTAWGAVRAEIKLGEVDFEVEASYDSNISGWQFKGGLQPAKPLDVADFIGKLLNTFGAEGRCPAALKGATIDALSVSFNTVTNVFTFCCVTNLRMGEKDLEVSLVIDIGDGALRCSGAVSLVIDSGDGTLPPKKVQFDLVFDQSPENKKTLVASYSDTEPVEVKLGDLIAMVSKDEGLIKHGKALTFAFKDALFVCESRPDSDADWLFAADLEAGLDFSGLPLIGASFAPGQGARFVFQPLLTSGGIETAALGDIMGDGGLTLPATQPAKGLSVTTKMSLGAEVIQLGLPVRMSDGKMLHDGGRGATYPPEVATVDNVSWIAAQKAFGPLKLERVGVRYQSGALDLLLDAHLSAAGLALDLEGFGVRVKLSQPGGVPPAQGDGATDGKPVRGGLGIHVTPILDGIGIGFRSTTLTIGGSLLRQQIIENNETVDVYLGSAVVKTPTFSVEAVGSYRTIDGHPSLFVYAALDYPIGGPAFFFVTGLAAAFGYNRSFKLPPIEQLASFPLLPAGAGKKDKGSGNSLRDVSNALLPHIPAEVGAIFLGVGVTFTTFQTIKSSALLTASFGKDVSFDLIGRSTLMMPAVATREQAVAVVEMAWVASFRPAEGLLALQAQLSPGSYVFSEDCQLTGGFAFYCWFSGPHEGQFVLTAGGYHPSIDLEKHAHFPRVPRLGVTWNVVGKTLTIKGDAYYALTSSAAMAGGHLEMVWDQHPYRAWCKAGIDCLFGWKPLHYTGEAYVEIGASYTFEFGGTRHITVEAGADLTVWGPPFSGRARVSLGLFSFDMEFGKGLPTTAPVHLFNDGYDVKHNPVGTGFNGLLPETERLCSVSVAAGLSRVLEKPKRWVVNPKTLSLVIDCVIPATRVVVGDMPRVANDGTSDSPSRFGIAPMALAHDEVTSDATITITKVGDDGWKPEKHLQYRLRRKGFPAALWGEPKPHGTPAVPAGEKLIDALCGLEIIPLDVAPERKQKPSEEVPGIKFYERHRPALSHGTYEVKVRQVLRARSAAGSHTEACCRDLVAESSLQFEVAAEECLPANCVLGLFPPQGSLGDHAHSLPQIILDRSTLPWESPAGEGVEGRTGDTPWLALLVFDGEKKAVPDSPGSGLPGPARIAVPKGEMPSAHDVDLLCHVRKGGAEQRAVVVANRPPSPGKLSTAHLVSLCDIKVDGTECRLISLWSWTFSCPEDNGTGFATLVGNLAKAPLARARLQLPRALPSGERAAADYHGPLGPKSLAADGRSGAGPAERVDISQLAAMELGRLLALRNKSVSVGLLRLKRRLAQGARQASQRLAAEHIYVHKPPPAARVAEPGERLLPAGLHSLLTPELADWAEGLVRLEGVPFRYILPDETMLPKESILAFQLDRQWMTNLLVGAFAVGGAWRLSSDADTASKQLAQALNTDNGPVGPDEEPLGALPTLSGSVLRSQLVPGWPAMSVRADGNRDPLVCRRLSKDILLALFPGSIKTIKFVLPPETLHYEGADGKPIPPDWLAHANSSIDLKPHVRFFQQEGVERVV